MRLCVGTSDSSHASTRYTPDRVCGNRKGFSDCYLAEEKGRYNTLCLKDHSKKAPTLWQNYLHSKIYMTAPSIQRSLSAILYTSTKMWIHTCMHLKHPNN